MSTWDHTHGDLAISKEVLMEWVLHPVCGTQYQGAV